MSDPDRGAVYRAEWTLRDLLVLPQVVLAGTTLVMPVERRFANLEDVQTYVNKVLALNWVQAEYSCAKCPLKVVRGRVINQATCGGGMMRINPDHDRFAMREVVVLHEIAHHLAPGGDAHGLKFRAAFVHLLTEIIGPEAGFAMKVLMADEGLGVYISA